LGGGGGVGWGGVFGLGGKSQGEKVASRRSTALEASQVGGNRGVEKKNEKKEYGNYLPTPKEREKGVARVGCKDPDALCKKQERRKISGRQDWGKVPRAPGRGGGASAG